MEWKVSSSPRGCSGILGFGMDPGGKFLIPAFFPIPKSAPNAAGVLWEAGILWESQSQAVKNGIWGSENWDLIRDFWGKSLKKQGCKSQEGLGFWRPQKSPKFFPDCGKSFPKILLGKGRRSQELFRDFCSSFSLFSVGFSLEKAEQIPIYQ